MSAPARASALMGRTPPARGRRGRELQDIINAATSQAEDRQKRVLAHEWSRVRLCKILGLRAATQWSGYVPPRAAPAPDRGGQVALPNTSQERAALVKLLREVEHFERTGELPMESVGVEQLAIK